MNHLRHNLPFIATLILLGVGVYAFNLHGPLFWDDADWILNNASLHALTWGNIKFIFSHDVLAGIGQVSNYYRPFLFLTFLANYLVGGSNPVGYHLVSNGIHILNACLIFYLLSRWLNNRRVAFLASLLFLIHPLQTEAVAYISGRGDPLSVMFMLLAVVAYLQYLKNRKFLILASSFLLQILAILSRETAVLFPAYLWLALVCFGNGQLKNGKSMANDKWKLTNNQWLMALRSVLPFLGVSAVYGILRLTVLNFQNTLNFYQQQNIYSEHLSYRIYTFFHALLVYLRLIIWPTGLHMDRDIPASLSITAGWAWLGLLLILGLVGWLIWLYRSETGKRVNGKSMANDKRQMVNISAFNVCFFGLGIFFVSLLPTSGIVPINARIYEHWLYFALFGFFTIVAWYLDKLLEFLKSKSVVGRQLLVVGLVIYCSFLCVQTIKRNILWGNPEAMYQNILAYEPADVRVLNNLGNWYSDHDNNTDAGPLYQRAIIADPTQPAPYYNLGNIARDAGQLDQAVELYKKSLSVDPTFHYAYGNLAQIYLKQNKLSQALDMLQQLEKIYPSPQTKQNIETLQRLINK